MTAISTWVAHWVRGLAISHFAHELAAKGIDDARDGWRLALADEVEIEHALHGAGLEPTVCAWLAIVVLLYLAAFRGRALLTRQSIVSWGGRAGVRQAGSLDDWELQSDGCCHLRRGHPWRRWGLVGMWPR